MSSIAYLSSQNAVRLITQEARVITISLKIANDFTLECMPIIVFLSQLKYLSYNELTEKMSNLDQEMEREIDDLRRRYHAKRQPILDAMDQKRKRQQNF